MLTRDLTLADVERLRVDAKANEHATVLQMDEDTFRAFYDRTSRAVWGYLARLTGDRQLADDLLQEAYYKFLRAGSDYDSEAHRRNALFRIATNLARDAYRRRQTRPVTEPHDEMQTESGQDAAGEFQRRTDLTRALNRMRPRERELLWLAYAEGSSHKEIANALGLKHGSVKLLLFRARRRLAGLLTRRTEVADAAR
jgi:RNA polymerase sigma-70 factor (ECF subfamily)